MLTLSNPDWLQRLPFAFKFIVYGSEDSVVEILPLALPFSPRVDMTEYYMSCIAR